MPGTYTPVLRPAENERDVLQYYGGLAKLGGTDHSLRLRPLVEIAGEGDLDELAPFRDAGDGVLVDLPRYWTNRGTKYSGRVNRTIEEYGSRAAFFRANSARIEVPVASSLADRPVEYGLHVSLQNALEDEFPRVAHRLLLRSRYGTLTPGQREALRDVADAARPDADVVLFDVVDTGYDEDGNVDEDLAALTTIFEDYEKTVLNVFDALDGHPENVTPALADRYGCEGFGDFAINRRYPTGGGPTPRTYLRHYYPHRGRVEVFEGSNYEDAARDLVDWDAYETDHCEWCRRATRTVQGDSTENPSQWKRIRMGHYIHSALNDQL